MNWPMGVREFQWHNAEEIFVLKHEQNLPEGLHRLFVDVSFDDLVIFRAHARSYLVSIQCLQASIRVFWLSVFLLLPPQRMSLLHLGKGTTHTLKFLWVRDFLLMRNFREHTVVRTSCFRVRIHVGL